MKQTKLTSEISCPTDSCLFQLVEHQSDDQEVMGGGIQIPLGAIFDEVHFVLCNFRSVRLSDRNAYGGKRTNEIQFMNRWSWNLVKFPSTAYIVMSTKLDSTEICLCILFLPKVMSPTPQSVSFEFSWTVMKNSEHFTIEILYFPWQKFNLWCCKYYRWFSLFNAR